MKSKWNLISIAFQSEKSKDYKKNKGMKQRNYTKKEAKKIKSENFTSSNRKKSNIAIAIFEKLVIG